MTDTKRYDRLDQWASDQIGVAPGASIADLRSRFLAGLDEAELVPDDAYLLAYRVLDPEQFPAIESRHLAPFRREEELRLLEEVDGLAHAMLGLSLATRQAEWERLLMRCEDYPRARAWLEALSPGLLADLSQVDRHDEGVFRLAKHLARLFPLRAAARAILRDEILTEADKPAGYTPRDVRRLRSRYPAIAALDPPLLKALTTSADAEKALIRARRKDAERRIRRIGSGDSGSRSGGHAWLVGLLLVVISIVGRLATLNGPGSSRPSYSPRYNQSQPYQGLDTDQLRELLESIRKQRQGDGQQPMPSLSSGEAVRWRQNNPAAAEQMDQIIQQQVQELFHPELDHDEQSVDGVAIPLPPELLEQRWPPSDLMSPE